MDVEWSFCLKYFSGEISISKLRWHCVFFDSNFLLQYLERCFQFLPPVPRISYSSTDRNRLSTDLRVYRDRRLGQTSYTAVVGSRDLGQVSENAYNGLQRHCRRQRGKRFDALRLHKRKRCAKKTKNYRIAAGQSSKRFLFRQAALLTKRRRAQCVSQCEHRALRSDGYHLQSQK